jgi:hypothetical protein
MWRTRRAVDLRRGLRRQPPPEGDMNAAMFHAAEQKIVRGANWFYWIAGLSIVNSITLAFDAKLTFPVGLGITQVFDGIASGMRSDVARVVGFCADAFVAILVVLVGYLARRYRGVYLLGMVLYGLDGVINLVFKDWIGAGFHAFALFSMAHGVRAFGERAAAASETVALPTPQPVQPTLL